MCVRASEAIGGGGGGGAFCGQDSLNRLTLTFNHGFNG